MFMIALWLVQFWFYIYSVPLPAHTTFLWYHASLWKLQVYCKYIDSSITQIKPEFAAFFFFSRVSCKRAQGRWRKQKHWSCCCSLARLQLQWRCSNTDAKLKLAVFQLACDTYFCCVGVNFKSSSGTDPPVILDVNSALLPLAASVATHPKPCSPGWFSSAKSITYKVD